MNKITDDVWITDIDTVRFANKSQFDQILTVCQDCIDDNVSSDTSITASVLQTMKRVRRIGVAPTVTHVLKKPR